MSLTCHMTSANPILSRASESRVHCIVYCSQYKPTVCVCSFSGQACAVAFDEDAFYVIPLNTAKSLEV